MRFSMHLRRSVAPETHANNSGSSNKNRGSVNLAGYTAKAGASENAPLSKKDQNDKSIPGKITRQLRQFIQSSRNHENIKSEIQTSERIHIGAGSNDNASNAQLEANLRLATQIVGEVSQSVPKSTNALESGRVTIIEEITDPQSGGTKTQITIPHRADPELRKKQSAEVDAAVNSWEAFFEFQDKQCRKWGMGNCAELAAMVCKSLQDQGARHIDYISITDGVTLHPALPHAIAVVGREDPTGQSQDPKNRFLPKNLDIGRPDTWNSSAVICDAWSRIAYPAKDFDQFWDVLKSYSKSPETLTCRLLHRLPE